MLGDFRPGRVPCPKKRFHTIRSTWFQFYTGFKSENVCKWCLQLILPCATSLRFQSPAFLLRPGKGNACWCVPVEDVRVLFLGMRDGGPPLSGFRSARGKILLPATMSYAHGRINFWKVWQWWAHGWMWVGKKLRPCNHNQPQHCKHPVDST